MTKEELAKVLSKKSLPIFYSHEILRLQHYFKKMYQNRFKLKPWIWIKNI